MKIIKGNESVSAETIEDFEDYHDVKLPADFRHFLLASNGGIPDKCIFNFDGDEKLIERFLPLFKNADDAGPAGDHDIGVLMTRLGDRIVFDEDQESALLVPIADLFAGDLVCLDFRNDPDNPSIVVWDHEESRDFSPSLIKIASGFTEFCGMLRTRGI